MNNYIEDPVILTEAIVLIPDSDLISPDKNANNKRESCVKCVAKTCVSNWLNWVYFHDEYLNNICCGSSCRKQYNNCLIIGCLCITCCWWNPFACMAFASDYDMCPCELCYCGCPDIATKQYLLNTLDCLENKD